MQSINHRFVLNDLHLEHNAFVIDISFEEVDLKFIMCLE